MRIWQQLLILQTILVNLVVTLGWLSPSVPLLSSPYLSTDHQTNLNARDRFISEEIEELEGEIIPIGKPSRLTARPAKAKNKNKNSNAKKKPLESEEDDEEVSTAAHILMEEKLGVVRNKPILPSWPKGVQYGQKMKWGGADKERFRQSTLGGIEVRYIEDPKHVLYRQYGVYASRPWEPFDIIGEYVGRVVPPKVGGEYVAVFERDDKGYLPSSELWGVDAKDYGNEIRMINHFKGIAGSPNCKLITATVNEFPHILVVVTKPIAVGEEVLLNYGPDYWGSKYQSPEEN